MNGLYHKQVMWKESFPNRLNNVAIYPSFHAIERAQEKGIKLPKTISGEVFEIELLNGRIRKAAIRLPYTDRLDLCVVVGLNGQVITCWTNKIEDSHKTLDKTKYIGG